MNNNKNFDDLNLKEKIERLREAIKMIGFGLIFIGIIIATFLIIIWTRIF